MDCLRSFSISTNQVGTYAVGNPNAEVKTWINGGDEYFAINIDRSSTFTIQGFKNIDIYGVELIGNVHTQIAASIGGVIVTDFSFQVFLEGQLPIIGGQISSDFFSIQTSSQQAKNFCLSKNTNKVNFESPIKSVEFIQLNNLRVQGIGVETSNTVSLEYNLNFVFYYKFEGE